MCHLPWKKFNVQRTKGYNRDNETMSYRYSLEEPSKQFPWIKNNKKKKTFPFFLLFLVNESVLFLQYRVGSYDFDNGCTAQRALTSASNQLISTSWTCTHVPASESKSNIKRKMVSDEWFTFHTCYQVNIHRPVQKGVNMAVTADTTSPFSNLGPFGSILWCFTKSWNRFF